MNRSSCLGGDARAQMRLAGMAGADTCSFLPTRPPEDFDGHIIDMWKDMLGVGADDNGHGQSWSTTPDRGTIKLPARYAVIHPGSGGAAKCWPAERFIDVGERLQRELGLPIIFVLGPAELERWDAKLIASIEGAFATLKWPALAELAAVLAAADIYIGNDSGVSHLAAAVGAPTLAIFGPSNPRHFAPIGPRVRIVAKPSLRDITADEVTVAAGLLMG